MAHFQGIWRRGPKQCEPMGTHDGHVPFPNQRLGPKFNHGSLRRRRQIGRHPSGFVQIWVMNSLPPSPPPNRTALKPAKNGHATDGICRDHPSLLLPTRLTPPTTHPINSPRGINESGLAGWLAKGGDLRGGVVIWLCCYALSLVCTHACDLQLPGSCHTVSAESTGKGSRSTELA